MTGGLPKRTFQLIAVALLAAAAVATVGQVVQGSGVVALVDKLGLPGGLGVLASAATSLLAWFALVIPLRLVTDFGEPLIPTRAQVEAALQAQAKQRRQARVDPRAARRQAVSLGLGGLGLAAISGGAGATIWLLDLGVPLGLFAAACVGLLGGISELVRALGIPQEP